MKAFKNYMAAFMNNISDIENEEDDNSTEFKQNINIQSKSMPLTDSNSEKDKGDS
jgi:hypothetical protein